MIKKSAVLLSVVLFLTSCSPSAQRVSNAEFNKNLEKLSGVEFINQKIEYENENGFFYTITLKGVREVAFTGYKYKGRTLGSIENPFRIYLYPEVFFKSGASFQRIIVCENKIDCTDVTLSYLDANRQFTPVVIPNQFYGLNPADISNLANRHAPAVQRLKFILQARVNGLQKLYMSSKNGFKLYTPKDRINVIRSEKGLTCYAWADNQDSMSMRSYRFNSCFKGLNYVKGDLADYSLTIKKKNNSSDIDPFGTNVKLLTDTYKLSPYGRMYLSVYQGIDSKYISSLNYQPVLPKRDI